MVSLNLSGGQSCAGASGLAGLWAGRTLV